MALTLDVRLDGYTDPIGTLQRSDSGAVAFGYATHYLGRQDAIALSLSLPLVSSPFDDPTSRFFFENLLQERDSARADIVARYRLATDDIAGILEYMGRDCTGAITVLPAGAPQVKVPGNLATDYRPLDDAEVVETIEALSGNRPLPKERADPSPLAGVQSKIALARLPDGRFAEPLPGSGAPTTHILKVPDPRRPNDAALEHLALGLSRDLGIPAASAELIDVNGFKVLIVERFDRRVDNGIVSRRHQEDFCQALGLSPRQKYQRRGTDSRRFDVPAIAWILDRTRSPVVEKRRFIEATIFDLLIGNVDAHAKNFSLFHLPDGGVETTPRYDLVPTRLDPNLTDELAYSIGAATNLTAVSRGSFDEFLAQLGIVGRAAQRRQTDRAVPQLSSAMAQALGEIQASGQKAFADLIGSNIGILCAALGFPVPPAAADRDASISKGGGWLLSS